MKEVKRIYQKAGEFFAIDDIKKGDLVQIVLPPKEEIRSRNLLEKIIHLSHIRGEKMALNEKIELDLDQDIAEIKTELLKRFQD